MDVLKGLYESLIDPEQRHDLGEYYTPDWLAARICERAITDPLHQRVLDPACGSGTFVFHAVRRFLAAADAARMDNRSALNECGQKVFGIDVHPVAAIIARVTYLLALSDRVRQDRGRINVPIYLGDSLQWNTTRFAIEGEVLIGIEGGDMLHFPLPSPATRAGLTQLLVVAGGRLRFEFHTAARHRHAQASDFPAAGLPDSRIQLWVLSGGATAGPPEFRRARPIPPIDWHRRGRCSVGDLIVVASDVRALADCPAAIGRNVLLHLASREGANHSHGNGPNAVPRHDTLRFAGVVSIIAHNPSIYQHVSGQRVARQSAACCRALPHALAGMSAWRGRLRRGGPKGKGGRGPV
ncbi:MAG: hypothetical protein C0506_15750 [Anaerolinea sp.]|nr:hypothetical protein [Anaerolinea sp.]